MSSHKTKFVLHEQVKTKTELFAIANSNFEKLAIPETWKCKGMNNVRDPEANNKLLSIGIVYMDTETSGFDIVHYRIYMICSTERLGVVKKMIGEKGKPDYKTEISNKTTEKINEHIYEKTRTQPEEIFTT